MGTAPVVLFDGVCNLCNGVVAWILERDKKGEFRFASLQSDAAREVAGNGFEALPDSIVLVDEDGVHVRSEAVLRIGKRLGFPYSLVGVGRVLPGFLRDIFYRFVARNRYRWFGRMDRCAMPRPEWKERFLDSGESIEVEVAAKPIAAEGFVSRLIALYLLLYIASHVGAGRLWRGIVQWFAATVLGVDASTLPAGSGDTTYSFAEILLLSLAALPLAALWRWRLGEWPRLIVRYFLALMMLVYGWAKVIPMQFQAPGPERLMDSIGDASPMGLLWTFMGVSTAYQIFAGAGEVLGGALLLFRRTSVVGALVSAVVLLQVVVLNFCYDVPVKQFSAHLLLMSFYVMAPNAMRVFSFLVLGMATPALDNQGVAVSRGWVRRVGYGLQGLIVVGGLVAAPVFGYLGYKERFAMPAKIPLHGLYAVTSFEGGGARWIRVAFNKRGVFRVQAADGTTTRYFASHSDGKLVGTLVLQGPVSGELTVTPLTEGKVRLEGNFETKPVKIELLQLPGSGWLLTSRGFRWVSETPFNR
jgi:predicted DCC family thiol-disulfide oxidoreductase YuxK